MRELDTLMSGWLDNHYGEATPAEREAFETLLTWQDPELIARINQSNHHDPGSELLEAAAQSTEQTLDTAKERDIDTVLKQIKTLNSGS